MWATARVWTVSWVLSHELGCNYRLSTVNELGFRHLSVSVKKMGEEGTGGASNIGARSKRRGFTGSFRDIETT